MRIETDMPLSDLIEKLLRGEAAEVHDEDFRTYMKNITSGNSEMLQQALVDIKSEIEMEVLLFHFSI